MPARPKYGAAPLGSRFWLVWTSVTVSGLGDGMRFAALPLLAAQVTSDPRQVSLVSLAEQLPWLLVGLLSGTLADRLDRRKMLWVTDSARAVLAGCFTLAVATGPPSIALLTVVGFLFGCGQVVYNGAWAGIVPALVGPGERTRANARLQAGSLVTDSLLGTPVGAVLFTWAVAAPFGVNTVSFAVAAVLVAVLPGDFSPRAAGTPGPAASLRHDMAEGLRWLWRHPFLRGLCLASAVSSLVTVGLTSVLVLYAREVLGLGGVGYGLLVAAFATGGLAGAAITPWLSARIGPGRTLCLAMAGSAVAAAGAGAVSSGVVSGCFIAGYGAMSLTWNVTAVSLRQDIVPSHLLGRVSMAYQMANAAAGALGAVTGGLLAHLLGLRSPFLVGAAVLLLAALVSVRRLAGARPAVDGPHQVTAEATP
ncbi:MFS transporter [Streptomyces sp. NPDC005181]|uniref:MFS transporter n=1 Tax=Streptomyces sp. NPDC005181 TaxID=3156869 RepID=UPI0033A7F722